jgi:hypothetical protein
MVNRETIKSIQLGLKKMNLLVRSKYIEVRKNNIINALLSIKNRELLTNFDKSAVRFIF